ncbi:SPOR domain-containing protein [Cognatiyoonia sp. IB215182]|uniref:SPOR domain-containing protein n=1 Tax=Cognatiyoonia sp. IB215182 TaxID=3097353 RepID=UPI002A0F3C73|nr:SPOR domain-containing protein [Cognatiyoonia sp. IB215182]MDX8352432.1 SPOR domain-containing protein [Cognatiyoonia sp. IB215182]
MGNVISKRRILWGSVAMAATLLLAACDENGEFAFPGDGAQAASAERPTRSIRTNTEGRDVERPDIFEVTDRGLWDGRPSLGGIWVAHPDVQDPERVIIRNTENGRSVVGALFRRERENPGPLLQVSSDAAEELNILAGAPTSLNVVVLRREEVVEEEAPAEPEVNPVVAALDAPVTVEAAPLDPIAGAAAAIDAAEDAGEVTAEAITAVPVALPAATEDTTPETGARQVQPALDAAGEADLTGDLIQIGVFSVEANATGAAERLRAAGIPASVEVQQAGGRDVWRLVASPIDEDAEATIARIAEQGFPDAFLVESSDG